MITKLSNDKNNYLLLLYFIILSIFFVFSSVFLKFVLST